MEISITDTFKDGVVFITGSTGFLGKILVEKLLRSCDVKTIAVIVRCKKGLAASQRTEDLYKQSVSLFLYFKVEYLVLFVMNYNFIESGL